MMMELLLEPIDAARPHAVGAAVAWHGRLMVLAWGVLFPAGILVARFFKVLPWQDWPRELDNKTWWRGHLILQYGGGMAMVAALILILAHPATIAHAGLHRYVGWTMAALVATQFVAGWLRGTKGGPTAPGPDGGLSGDHYDMTPRRLVFEYFHKAVGYFLVLLSVSAILSGLWIANGPVWMWLVLLGWWAALLWAFCQLQRRGYAVDTYQAIWGPGPEHPGNRVKPVGWGIRRRS